MTRGQPCSARGINSCCELPERSLVKACGVLPEFSTRDPGTRVHGRTELSVTSVASIDGMTGD